MGTILLDPLDKTGIAWAQKTVTEYHYRHSPMDVRCSVEGYAVLLENYRVGLLLFGRPEATRCYPWYGSVEEAGSGLVEVTRWQVLNLARVWLSSAVQVGGSLCTPDLVPGYYDRKGIWRSTLASTVIGTAAQRIGFDYLVRRPPVFLDEPYQIEWLLSYCDPAYHKGTIYRESGFQLYRTNAAGLMTWRIRLPELTQEQLGEINYRAKKSKRSQSCRAKRAQIGLPLG